MTGFSAYLLLRFNLEVLRLFLCVAVILSQVAHTEPLPYMVYNEPESGTDHSLKVVRSCLIWHGIDTGASRVTVTSFLSAILDLLLYLCKKIKW